jgi:hypothetical protein
MVNNYNNIKKQKKVYTVMVNNSNNIKKQKKV